MPDFKLHEAFAKGAADNEAGAEEADNYKNKGNDAFKNQKWDEAIKQYNKAISLDPMQASYYSNRAACWSSKGNHESALADAKKCLDADSNFIKGYSRKGKALFDLGRLDEAETAYQEGLAKDASNAGCLTGVADIKKAKAASSSSSWGGFGGGGGGGTGGGGGGAFGGVAGMGRKFMDSMKTGGMGGRMQMYAVVMVAYFAYNNFIKGGSKSSSASSSSHETSEDDGFASAGADDPAPRAVKVRRSFTQVDGNWVSYLEAGRGDSLMLMLHSTSLSAEVELTSTIDQVFEKATPPPAGGLQVLAPDRPCHGLTPCPKLSSKARGADWLEALLGSRKAAKQLTIVACGRQAAQQALAIARERTKPSQLLLVSPTAADPSRGAAGILSSKAEATSFLETQPKAAPAKALADVLRWAASAPTADADEADEQGLIAHGLPEGSRVSMLYAKNEKEELDFREELEVTGLLAKSRQLDFDAPLLGSDEFAEAVAEEVSRLLSASEDGEQ